MNIDKIYKLNKVVFTFSILDQCIRKKFNVIAQIFYIEKTLIRCYCSYLLSLQI